MTHFFTFICLESVLPSVLNDVCSWYRIVDWRSFSLIILRMLLYFFSGVYGFWSEVSGSPVCKYVFSPSSFFYNLFLHTWFSAIWLSALVWDGGERECVCVYIGWDSLSLDQWVDTFHWIWSTFDYYFFINFLSLLCPSLSIPPSDRNVSLILLRRFWLYFPPLYFILVFSSVNMYC